MTNLWDTLPKAIQDIGTIAVEAMLMEANCAPAPGLVDRFNSGAHNDMDIFTFIKSSAALGPAMYNFAAMGYTFTGELHTLLQHMRSTGIDAEQDMFKATNNVNTQKGLLFLLGILCAASGYTYKQHRKIEAQTVLNTVKVICSNLVAKELGNIGNKTNLTAGEHLYVTYGVRGIRGEMEDGLPAILEVGLPAYREAKKCGVSIDQCLIHTLLSIMTVAEDTTILHRHDMDTLQRVQSDAKRILSQGGTLTEEGLNNIYQLDKEYTDAWISPGGSADLLAATHFLYTLEETYA